MEQRPFFRRLFSVEVLGAATVGALLPYMVALAIEVAPTRVPMWLVVLSVAGCSLGWVLVQMASSRRQRVREELERRERERQELKAQLERIEQTMEVALLSRKFWPKRRKSPVIR
jgi:threonine/homoserine/homoserine lactone efflux protein